MEKTTWVFICIRCSFHFQTLVRMLSSYKLCCRRSDVYFSGTVCVLSTSSLLSNTVLCEVVIVWIQQFMKAPHHYGKSHTICYLPAVTFPLLPKPKLVLNLAFPQGCKECWLYSLPTHHLSQK